VSLTWFSASPNVIPFSSWSTKEVSSTFVFEFSADAAFDSLAEEAEAQSWIPCRTLVTF
jgi:hypothetical protein